MYIKKLFIYLQAHGFAMLKVILYTVGAVQIWIVCIDCIGEVYSHLDLPC